MKGKLTTYASDIVLVLLGLGCFSGVQYGTLITIVTIILAIADICFPRYASELAEALEQCEVDEEEIEEEA